MQKNLSNQLRSSLHNLTKLPKTEKPRIFKVVVHTTKIWNSITYLMHPYVYLFVCSFVPFRSFVRLSKTVNLIYNFVFQVNFEDVCEYTPTKCSAPLPMSAFNKDSRDQITKLMKEQFNIHGKGFSRHFYYGDKNGYFIAYPAQKTDREICHCRAFDPRFR